MDTNTKQNPLLARAKLPGEIHRIPSRGMFYRDGELDQSAKDGEVEIFPMTAHDEIVMRSPDLLFSGTAVVDTIRRCVPQILKPDRLLAKDVDFIMMVLRKVSYGDDLELRYKHTCENAKEHSYIASMDRIIRDSKSIDPTSVGSGYTVALDNDQIVKLEPLRYTATINLMQASDKDMSTKEREAVALDLLASLIVSVDEITDKNMIKEWLQVVPIKYTKQINKALDESQSNWGPDYLIKLKCKDCGAAMEIQAPMNPVTFFI